MARGAIVAVLCTLLAGCNVFEELEDCQADAERALGQRCHPTGHFCEAEDHA